MSDVTVAAAEAQAKYEQRAFGFWLYLMSDAIIFSLLFATYAVMVPNSAGGPTAKTLFSLTGSFAETLVLLVSSMTFAFASLAMESGDKIKLLGWLSLTFVLGSAFVGMEIRDFSGMITTGAGPDRSGFLSAFFTLVGTHGLHVTFGLMWIQIMAAQVIVKGLDASVTSRLMRLGLFWHFLDIVWVGIFSVVYLPGIL
jgi:cytochrome o ubiquinol oxidase subunit 3